MSQTHTIVVRFHEGIVPRYSAATGFQGGQVVAVDFDGDRLLVAQELEEALAMCLESMETGLVDYNPHDEAAMDKARAALAKARGEEP